MTKKKKKKKPFKTSDQCALTPVELVHTYVYGPINVIARGGYEYFIIFIDDYLRYGYIYLMHYKLESFVKFK